MASEATLKFLLVGEDRSAGKALRNAGRDAESTGEKFKRLGKVAAVGLAGGLVTAGSAMVKFGQQASDLGETQSKVAQIFGKESTAALDKFAEAAGKNLGQSEQQALDAAATFGIIGKSAGKSGTDLVKFSTQMTGLAGDLASFNNSTPEEAIEAIGSAMRGEAEPIRKYGVLLDDATLRAEALELGLIKSVKEGLTPQKKALAAQAAILKQTKDAQGDFARTSDGLANKQRILKAEFTNLTTEIGQKALPVMLDVTNAALDLVEGFEEGTGAGGKIRDVLEDIGDAGKAVFEFFDSIPGPVKKYGAELAVAAVVMSKFRTLTGPVSAGLSTMVTNFKSAETRAAGLKKGLAGLNSGARNLAGAGGMVLLADSADEAGTKMGTLKAAAGGAALGFAVGGPVGAAVGGLAGGLISLATATDGATESTKISIPSWREYGATLDGVSASTSKATREMVLQRLEKSGLLKATRELGLSDREAVNAMTGGTAARRKLTDALSRNRTLTVEQQHALEKETGAVGAARLATLKRNVALAETGAELKAAKEELRKFMKAPADKRIGIHGVEQASAQLIYLQKLLNGVFASKRNNAPSTGDPTADLLLGVGAYEIPGKNPADGGTILSGGRLGMAYGGTVAGQRAPYGDKVMKLLAPGEEVISNRNGQADRFRPLLKAINAGGMANGGSVGAETSPVPLFDYRQLAQEIVSAMQRGAPLVRLSDAGRGAYQSGASF